MLNPILAAKNIKDEFVGYISTLFHIADKEYETQFVDALNENGAIAKGPYLDVSDSYETGKCIAEFIAEGELSPLFQTLEGSAPDGTKELQIQRPLYTHQEESIRKINQGQNLIVTTGTGSGKTECFTIPILNHLLREAERGELSDGVRAIIIYPMNALANDQMKRLRKLLKDCPQITFGVYNSSTQRTTESGIAEYGKIYKDSNGRPLPPLPNEIISRDQMQKTPPHILVTNYAMLEYMMLRPKDDLVFSGARLQFLVLDEAHIYRGTTGMETALLLKRLKARISNPDNVLHILTSATLGGPDSNPDIVKFASTLCDAPFLPKNIVRSKGAAPSYEGIELQDIPLEMFAEIADPAMPLSSVVEKYGIVFPEDKEDAEFLYDLCLSSNVYRCFRKIVHKPMTVPAITVSMNEFVSVNEQDVINLVNVAARASKNQSALIKARYHMFARALEGAYITVGTHKTLTLNRTKEAYIDGEHWKRFECAICDDCGRIAVAGQIENGTTLEFANSSYDENIEYFLISDKQDDRDDMDIVGDDDEMLDRETENSDIAKNDFLLCSKCGALVHESLKDELCDCGSAYLIRVKKARKTASRKEGVCPCCTLGKFKTFYLGYDAATAVLGTSLFEELPESEKKIKDIASSFKTKKGLFVSSRPSYKVEEVKRMRQFLSFSDSRGEAAFFASYMTASYKEFLRRRGIWHVIEKNRDNMSAHPWEISTFVEELTSYFDSSRTFASPGDNGSENLTAVSRKNAWIAVLNEMVNARRSTSLSSLGVLKFNYKGNTEDIMEGVAEKYGQNTQDVKALFDLLVMDIVYFGALEGDCTLTDDDREYIFFTAKPKRFKAFKDYEADKKKSYLAGWSCGLRKSGSLQKNGRLARVMKVLETDEDDANGLLQMYWNNVLCDRESLTHISEDEYYFTTNRFTISAGTEAVPIYSCNVCGKTTMVNCKNLCASVKCNGNLRKITHESLLDGNHYATLYRSSLMAPLHIREHTAQLGRQEQQKYQEMFINKDINALSCSTTFEMGVDVGDLETVYLRDMPPTPANYVQRAGRAGRSLNAAAFSLTYAKLSSHDFTYFREPEKMISGKISAPLFTVKNVKVIQRHIFAVALSAFFSKYPNVYNANDADVFLNGNGWELLCGYLSGKPSKLKAILKKSIPADMHDTMGINDYSWTERLIGADGVLTVAVNDFRSTVSYYESERLRLLNKGKVQEAAAVERKLRNHRRGKGDNYHRNELIEFLVRNNVLPKYGFPVDTVELYQNSNSKATVKQLQMVRDLQLAISEYAPDAQIVADDKLYTSRYIRKLPQTNGQDWETVYIAQCHNKDCMTWNYHSVEPGGNGDECISCHEVIPRFLWKQAIQPRKGFIADDEPKAVPMHKPDKIYKSDDYYIGDPVRRSIEKYAFSLDNGLMFQMETTTNDSLMVVCDDDFYVCSQCGYAESTSENKGTPDFNSHIKTIDRKHKSPWGKSCNGKLHKNKLCHTFKTDVVHLIFSTDQAWNPGLMLSVMYALLEALSLALDIERNDIKGCLHKITYRNQIVYSIVLYDAVAGGAGHVRRLVTEDGRVFAEVVKKAIAITKGCNCDPSCYSCLRNYYNQKIHNLLDRKLAYTFLENFVGEYTPISEETFVGSIT